MSLISVSNYCIANLNLNNRLLFLLAILTEKGSNEYPNPNKYMLI